LSRLPIFDHLTSLADPTRIRILAVLERGELTVSELCAVLQLPQSTVSRHLKVLSDSSWLGQRSEATRNFYRLEADDLGPAARRLWMLVREGTQELPAADQDRARLEAVITERRSRSAEFFSASAQEWSQLRRELFGERFDLHALLGLVDPDWVVGDLGCGTGELSAALAPFVRRVIAVDSSLAMLDAARQRLAETSNVEVRGGELEQLPIEDGALDAATLFLVLHHLADPARAVREAARALRPGGVLLLVDTRPHDREDLRRTMGHVWLGFPEDTVSRHFQGAGLEAPEIRSLPVDPQAKGPALFVARGRRVASTDVRRQADQADAYAQLSHTYQQGGNR
jgi:ArsR family transcriptional regulator